MSKKFGFSGVSNNQEEKDFGSDVDVALFDEGIAFIIEHYNFEKVEKVMRALNITWGGEYPTEDRLIETVEELATNCLEVLIDHPELKEIRMDLLGFDFQYNKNGYMYLTYNVEDIVFE